MVYASNEGQPFQNGALINIELFSEPSNYYFILSNMGFLWVPAFLLWRHIKDDFARRSLFVAVPFLLGSFLIGQYTELRGFGELIPVVVSAFILELKVFFEKDERVELPAPRGQ
jgi:hypothetical protein